MKFRLKGLRSLIKAIRNRDHLVPVITLISGKTKTFYAKRYVSPGEAMETAKEDFKINPYQEAIFESKDGKRKNITEKEVLEMYDEAGKPGVLQDFIKQNFKKPKIKASTKDNGQLSFDNMVQGNNKKTSDKEKTEKLWQEFEELRVKAGNNLKAIVRRYDKKVEDMTPSEYRKIMTDYFERLIKQGQVKSGKNIEEKLESFIEMFKRQIEDNEEKKKVWNDDYYKELYSRFDRIVNKYAHNRGVMDTFIKIAIKEFTQDKFGQDEVAAMNAAEAALNDILSKKEVEPESGITITGPIYDDDERPTYYINDNGNVLETQDPKVVEQYRQKQKEFENQVGTDGKDNNPNNDSTGKEKPEKENKNPQDEISDPKQIIIDKLQQKGAMIWRKGGYNRLYFNEAGKEVADRVANEEGIYKESSTYKSLEYFTNKTYLDLKSDKLYMPQNGYKGYELDPEHFKKMVQYMKEMYKNIDTKNNENVKLLNAEGEEKLLKAIDGKISYGNPYIAYFDASKMLKLTGLDEKHMLGTRLRRKYDTLEHSSINLITGKVTTRSGDSENIIPTVQEFIDKLISEIKAETQGNEPEEPEKPEEPQKTEEPEKEIEKLAFRSVGLSGGLIRYNALRKGTTKIESKNEYKPIKNINELVKQVKPIKDAHTNIKGRAIMDMFGISADLYTKANNIPFPMGPGAVGYCTRLYDEQTGVAHIFEIGLVADRNNPAAETKTAIHECMHAKIGMSGKNKLLDAEYGKNSRDRKALFKVEEPMVELAGQAVAHQIHGDETKKNLHSYANLISNFLPRVWSSDVFKGVRKQGALGIGQEIAKQLTNGNVDFINKVYDAFNTNNDKKANSNRMKAIETKVLERTDKVEKIQNDTGVSEIANLVEELKRGTISLEGALNSSKYRELAAVLITKFLEDEDMEALEQLALSF